MRCYICDASLSDKEIKYERNYKAYAPCKRCIDASGVRSYDVDNSDLDSLGTDILKNEENAQQPETPETGQV